MLSPIEWRMECLKLAANTSQKQDEILAAAKSFVGFVMEVQERSDLTAIATPDPVIREDRVVGTVTV